MDLWPLTKGVNTSDDLALAFAAFPFQTHNHFPSNKLTGFVSKKKALLFPESTMPQPVLAVEVVFVDAIKDGTGALISRDASLSFTHPSASGWNYA